LPAPPTRLALPAPPNRLLLIPPSSSTHASAHASTPSSGAQLSNANPPSQNSSPIMPAPNIERMTSEVADTIRYMSSRNSNIQMRFYFGIPNKSQKENLGFYDMVNEMYKRMNINTKERIVNYFRNTLNMNIPPPTDVSNISPGGYGVSIENINIFQSETNGNCYFDALQQSINMYNKNIDIFDEPLNKKIIYDIGNISYGSGNELFTQECLREIISEYAILRKYTYAPFLDATLNQINANFQDAIQNSNAPHPL
jgi:hypothetical protein